MKGGYHCKASLSPLRDGNNLGVSCRSVGWLCKPAGLSQALPIRLALNQTTALYTHSSLISAPFGYHGV